MALARCVRSRIVFWAFSGISQSCGSSASAFSSSRRRSALSQSKMPPQQGQGRSDLPRQSFNLGTHGLASSVGALVNGARTWPIGAVRSSAQHPELTGGLVDAAAAVGGGRRRWRGLGGGGRRLAHGRRLQGRLLRLLGLLGRLLLLAGRRDAGRQDVRLRVVRLTGDDRLAVLRGI